MNLLRNCNRNNICELPFAQWNYASTGRRRWWFQRWPTALSRSFSKALEFRTEFADYRAVNAREVFGQVVVRNPVAQVAHAEPAIDVMDQAPFRKLTKNVAEAFIVERQAHVRHSGSPFQRSAGSDHTGHRRAQVRTGCKCSRLWNTFKHGLQCGDFLRRQSH